MNRSRYVLLVLAIAALFSVAIHTPLAAQSGSIRGR